MTITLYSKPGCQPCRLTARKLEAAGIPFREVDVTEVPAALEYITEELGYSAAPVVVVDDQEHWSGLRPDKIAALIATTTK